MAKGDDKIELAGRVTEAMGGGRYRIQIEGGATIHATVGGKMKKAHIRVLPGDQVKVHVSQYDMTHGIIIFRSR